MPSRPFRMPSRRALRCLAPIALMVLMVPLSGCCTLGRLFCGPDESPWISESYETPTRTVATLLEALRRDAPDVVYRCLSAEFLQQNQLGSLEFQIMWDRLKEQVTGLHLAGYAAIPAPTRLADDGATFELEVEGHKLQIDVVRESFRELVYERPNGTRGDVLVPIASWNTWAKVEWIDDPDFDRSQLVFEPLLFEHEGLDEVPLATIQRAGLIRLWKVTALRTLE